MKIMSQAYITDAKRLIVVHESNNIPMDTPSDKPKVNLPIEHTLYDPISLKFWNSNNYEDYVLDNDDENINNPPGDIADIAELHV